MTFSAWDNALFFALNGYAGHSPFQDALIVGAASYLPYVLVAGFALYLLAQRSRSMKEKALAFGSAIAAGLIARIGIGSPIRFFFPRLRPFLTYHVQQLIQEHAPSFPSGHALFFFAFSTIVYFTNKRLGYLFYLLTIIVCIGRVAAGIHYPSDILAGAVFGIFTGWAVHRFLTPAVKRATWWKALVL